MVGLENESFEKNQFERTSTWCHVELGELPKHTDYFLNQSFSWSDISGVQLKANWTVGERRLASDQSQFNNGG